MSEDTVDGTAEEIDFQFVIYRKTDGEILLKAVDEATKPDSLDDVWFGVSTIKRNLEAQHQAALMQHMMMATAAEMSGAGKATDSGLIIPDNKNIK